MNPREMFIEGILSFQYPGNCHKRVDRIEKLADSIGAQVDYGLNNTSVGIEYGGEYYTSDGLRDAERVLRWLKKETTVNQNG